MQYAVINFKFSEKQSETELAFILAGNLLYVLFANFPEPLKHKIFVSRHAGTTASDLMYVQNVSFRCDCNGRMRIFVIV